MRPSLTRRDFLHETALLGVAAAAMRAADGLAADAPVPGELPKIKLGNLEVSRLILGSNPFFGYAHRDAETAQAMNDYYTEERIMQVLDEAAALGVTAVTAPPMPRWLKVYTKYLERGGKLRTWIAQPHASPRRIKAEIAEAARAGARAMFIQGERVDEQFAAGKLDLLREWVEHIKSFNVPAGMASHRPDTHLAAEKAKLPTDFYYQCFFRPEDYGLEHRDRAVAAIRQIEKPVVGYKILAAGRLPPEEAFSFAFAHLAPKDGVCVGMFPKDKAGMLAEDVKLAQKHSAARTK